MPKLIAGHTLINYDENVAVVKIPQFVFAIADRAFSERGAINRIEMTDSVKSIGSYAFRMCYNMRSIALPDRVDEFGVGVFEKCWALESVILPEGVIRIGREMFAECNSLKEISIPSTIEDIDNAAFSRCSKLERIIISPEKFALIPSGQRATAVISYMADHSQDDELINFDCEAAEQINNYAKTHLKSVMKLAVKRGNAQAVRYMISNGLIPEDGITDLVNIAAEKKSTEIIAMLIDEQDKRRELEIEEKEDYSWNPFA